MQKIPFIPVVRVNRTTHCPVWSEAALGSSVRTGWARVGKSLKSRLSPAHFHDSCGRMQHSGLCLPL